MPHQFPANNNGQSDVPLGNGLMAEYAKA